MQSPMCHAAMPSWTRRTCEITPREVFKRTWDDVVGVWHADEMTVENRSSGLLPVRSDGRLWIRALKEMRELRGQGGVSGQSKLRVVLYERLSVPDITRRWKKKTHPDRKRAVSSKHPRRLWPHPPPIKPMSRLCYPIPHIIVSSYHTHTHTGDTTYQRSSHPHPHPPKTPTSPRPTGRT